MIQMDASIHHWFGLEKAQLHIAVDDATGTIVGAYFDKEETLKGYYNVFYQILRNYGIPYMFYTDRRTVFEYKQKNPPLLKQIHLHNLVMPVSSSVYRSKPPVSLKPRDVLKEYFKHYSHVCQSSYDWQV